jgi:hypothetical protein
LHLENEDFELDSEWVVLWINFSHIKDLFFFFGKRGVAVILKTLDMFLIMFGLIKYDRVEWNEVK